jgi:hypothetical protein
MFSCVRIMLLSLAVPVGLVGVSAAQNDPPIVLSRAQGGAELYRLHIGVVVADARNGRGVRIARVVYGSLGAAAGLRADDTVLTVDDSPVNSAKELARQSEQWPLNDTIAFGIQRGCEGMRLKVSTGHTRETPTFLVERFGGGRTIRAKASIETAVPEGRVTGWVSLPTVDAARSVIGRVLPLDEKARGRAENLLAGFLSTFEIRLAQAYATSEWAGIPRREMMLLMLQMDRAVRASLVDIVPQHMIREIQIEQERSADFYEAQIRLVHTTSSGALRPVPYSNSLTRIMRKVDRQATTMRATLVCGETRAYVHVTAPAFLADTHAAREATGGRHGTAIERAFAEAQERFLAEYLRVWLGLDWPEDLPSGRTAAALQLEAELSALERLSADLSEDELREARSACLVVGEDADCSVTSGSSSKPQRSSRP